MKRHIRSGNSNDVTSLAPVLIPLHAVLDEKDVNEIPKSHTASQMLHKINLSRIDPISGVLFSKLSYILLFMLCRLLFAQVRSALCSINTYGTKRNVSWR